MMPAAIERVAGRRGRRLLLAAAAAGAMGLCAGPATAAGAPVLGITMTHLNPYGVQASLCETKQAEPLAAEPCGVDPFTETEAGDKGETFARESADNAYTIKVSNTGEEATSGPLTVTDQLPEGIVLAGGTANKGNEAVEAPGWACKEEPGVGGVNVGAVKCSTSSKLAKGEPPKTITLHVLVEPQAAETSTNGATETSTNGATVSEGAPGGGASPASTTPQEGETTVTPAVPFGISSFSPIVWKEPEEPLEDPLSDPFSQAGGHPFAVSTELVLNSTTSAEGIQGNLVAAGGGPKELEVESPPGFSGNPQNAPQCPLKLLEETRLNPITLTTESQCPANTAVGFAQVTAKSGAIFKGKIVPFTAIEQAKKNHSASLVYNMQPSPGSPAEFGFTIAAGVPFLFEAKVRSGGDYGVTVGDSAVGEKPLATRVTLCANGAQEVNVEKKEHYACKAAPPNSEPFLRNPTECSSSPLVWTLAANPWDEPLDHVSQNAVTSPIEGCESQQFNAEIFHPEIEFKPSPPSEGGTTQADEPTGMTVDLKNPQTNEADVNATPDLKNVVMKLPPGMTVSPSAADGLQACTPAQFWPAENGGGPQEHREPAVPAECPLASQVGTVEVFTPLLSGAPTVEGVPGIGQKLTCSQGTWSASPVLSYQWLRAGAAITGATAKEYAPVAEDEAQALQCQVTATNAAGSSVAVSRNTVDLTATGPPIHPIFLEKSPKPPRPPASIAAPSGAASAGNTLTCAAGRWTTEEKEGKEEATTFAYQWLRGGSPIAGANASNYTLTSADEGKVIQCQVTGTGTVSTLSAIGDSAAVVASPQPSMPPLPGAALQGQLFVAQPECSPCTNEDAEDGKQLRLFLQAQDPTAGVIVKVHGQTSANRETGQLTTTFEDQPQQPLELLHLKLKGGPRAVLANPQSCGPATTIADLAPWSGTPDATPTSTYNVDFDGAGGACPETLPFSPFFNAGTTGPTASTAGAYTNFSLTFGRRDREQNLAGLTAKMPLGLVAKIAGIPRCPEAQANEGTCGPESQIGTTTAGAGPGPHPLFLGGKVYLTGPYKNAPFGLSIVVPAVAGPFNLGNEVVRSAIYIDPNTAAVTVVSDPLKQIRSGVPFRLREVNVEVNRPEFELNPTNCSPQQVSATVTSAQGTPAQVSSPFGIGGCGSLPFHPELTAEVGGNATKANGTTFIVRVKSTPGQANIAKTDLTLPVALPSRLTTIQKACVDSVFEANPASCPEGSNIGFAIAHSPLLNSPLVGPAYLVSHGGAAFPDVEFVLQGEGVLLILDGKTDIKKEITFSRFETVPDAPVSTFETVLPAGPHSALTANVPEKEHFSLCNTKLEMPTEITGQNGAVIKQTTHIAITGCARKPSVKIAKIRHTRNGLLVTATTNAAGTVWVSGAGLKTTHKKLPAGTHQIRVAFTKWGIFMHEHHKKTSVRVKLIDGRQAVAKSSRLRL